MTEKTKFLEEIGSIFHQIIPLETETGSFCITHEDSMKQNISKPMGGDLTAEKHQCAKCKKHLDIDEKMAGPFLCGSCQGGFKQ
jgi:hypothetical protein